MSMPSKKTRVDLWERNRDYSVFLPSISSFYNSFVSKQHHTEFVPKERIPAEFENGIEGMNFLNKEEAYYYYPWALYSAGHAQLDVDKSRTEESMIHRRNRKDTMILGDSGGFQIGNGQIKFDWEHFYEQRGDTGYKGSADKVRDSILNWLEETADYSMILDIPTRATEGKFREMTGMKSFGDALNATMFNNDYFVRNRKGKTKFLNVLQGQNGADADIWYEKVKHYDFEGWAMGGLNMRDANLAIRRLITMRDEKLLEPGRDLIHYLGTSKLEWAVLTTAIQRNLRKSVNPNITLTYDCASPFIATAKGQIYTQHVHRNNRFSYIMDKALDDKRLSGSKAQFPWHSPVGERMTMGDVCYYAPGMLNKIGKEGKTSWDSFSYFLQMGHNVYQHLDSVQRANALTDAACEMYKPDPGTWTKAKSGEFSHWVPKNLVYMTELVNRVFESETPMTELARAESLIAEFNSKKTIKSSAETFNSLFEADLGSDHDAGQVEDWLEEDADELLRNIA
jgi:hypothetical protein